MAVEQTPRPGAGPPKPQAKSPSSGSARRTQRPTPRSQPSPTRTIQAGREHLKIAEAVLKTGQRAVKDRAGLDLDIGEFPSYAEAGDSVDPQRPVKILGHAVARVADRFTIFRKVSRHLEGSENRAGIGSDLIAEAYELYARNTEVIDQLLRDWLSGTRNRAMTRKADKKAQANASENGAGMEGIEHATR